MEELMAGKLTETRIARAKVPHGKTQAFLWDAAVPGFGLRILAGGSKTFWFMYRPAGGRSVSSRMVRIGRWHTGSLNGARRRAKDLAGAVARGEDPAADKQEERRRASSTLRTLLAEGGDYERHLAGRHLVNRKTVMRTLRRGLARLMGKDVADIKRADFLSAIDAIKDQGKPGAAADLRKCARTFCEWCVHRGFAPANVLAGLRQSKTARAERLASET